MYKLKIKTTYELMGMTYKAEKCDKYDNLNNVDNMLVMYYENLLYIYEQLNVCNYELQYKVDNNEWMYFNNVDYCRYLKEKYFFNNENITVYTLSNKLDDMKFTRFLFYVKGLRENEN